MKSYYHLHEIAYQRIKSNGYVGWGNAKTLADLGDPKTNEYLDQKLKKYFPDSTNKTALDLGCGTGTTAFILARNGLITTGIDISQTAIEIGQQLAQQQDLRIEFIADDILDLKILNKKFDFIYDSHFLHCIVFTEDRKKVLDAIKQLLQPNGIFVLDTMVVPEKNFDAAKLFSAFRFDQDFILWHKSKPSQDHGVIEIDGQHWCAQRRIYPSEKVMSEVLESGFEIVEKQIDDQQDEPSMLRLVLK